MVDPNADDPEGLVERVRRASVTEPVEPRVPQQSRRPPEVIEQSLVRLEPAIARSPRPSEPVIKKPRSAGDSPSTGRRYLIGAAITVGLVTAGAFAVWAATDDGTPPTGPPSDGGEVAAPFESATLYGMANPLFAASDCFVPDRQDAPVASKLPHIELVKCANAPYKATFLCAGTIDDFRGNQRAFLGYAVPGTQQDVSGAPAGQSGAIDGLQRAFVHRGGHGARVYWDSPSTLCAGELQAETDDVAAAIDYWRNGYAS
jgi:hypothetical protein